MFTHTAVTSRNAVRQLIRSMNGMMLSSTLTDFLSPVPRDAPMRTGTPDARRGCGYGVNAPAAARRARQQSMLASVRASVRRPSGMSAMSGSNAAATSARAVHSTPVAAIESLASCGEARARSCARFARTVAHAAARVTGRAKYAIAIAGGARRARRARSRAARHRARTRRAHRRTRRGSRRARGRRHRARDRTARARRRPRRSPGSRRRRSRAARGLARGSRSASRAGARAPRAHRAARARPLRAARGGPRA